jgi:hypothetical protein
MVREAVFLIGSDESKRHRATTQTAAGSPWLAIRSRRAMMLSSRFALPNHEVEESNSWSCFTSAWACSESLHIDGSQQRAKNRQSATGPLVSAEFLTTESGKRFWHSR